MSILRNFGRKLGVPEYLGTWNAATNSPAITSGQGQRGGYYIVSMSGSTSINGISDWGAGDWIIFNGSAWEKVDNSELGISRLSGDVTAQGPGQVSCTVNSVGGSSASAVNSATLLANSSTSTNTPSTIVRRDSSGSFVASGVTAQGAATASRFILTPQTTTATTNGTIALTNSSATVQFITGTATGFAVVLPDARTLEPGVSFEIYNRSSSTIAIKYSDGTTLGALSRESVTSLILQSNSTQNGTFSPFTVEIAQAAGIANYTATGTTPFSTNSSTDVVISDFTVTPVAGTYALFFNCSCLSTNQNSLNYATIYKGNTPVVGSERVAKAVGNSFEFQLSSMCIATFDGTEELKVAVRVTAGTVTVNGRTGVALRLGT